MAVYHFSAQIFSRGKGHSAVAKAAYRAGTRLHDDRLGREWDYSKKENVVHSEILAPEAAPEWIKDREKLWNQVEQFEKRKDAQLGRELEISLPRELSHDQQVDLARGFADREFVSKGYAVDLNIHSPPASDGSAQPHFHMTVTMRRVDKDGFEKTKDRSLNDPDQLRYWREKWAEDANAALEKAGFDARIDHRSLKDQKDEALQNGDFQKAASLDRIPQTKSGTAATGIKKSGRKSKRADFQQQIKLDNQERQELAKSVINIKADVQSGKITRADAGDRLDKLAGQAGKKAEFWQGRSRIGQQHWSALSSQLKSDAQATRLGSGTGQIGQAAGKIGGATGKAGGAAGAAFRPGKKPRLPGADLAPKGGDAQAVANQTSQALKKLTSAMVRAAMPTPGGGAAGSIAKSIIKGPGRRL